MNTKTELLNYIDTFIIYDKDYDAINSLLSITADEPEVFAKVLEEVMNGELYWSDFDRVLGNNYESILRASLEAQTKMKELVRILSKTGSNIGSAANNSILFENLDEDVIAFYNQRYNRDLRQVIYELTSATPNDTVLSRQLKTQLLSSIYNYDSINYADVGSVNAIVLNPDDIFRFINTYFIPLDYEHQVLDSFDQEFINRQLLEQHIGISNSADIRREELENCIKKCKSLILTDIMSKALTKKEG